MLPESNAIFSKISKDSCYWIINNILPIISNIIPDERKQFRKSEIWSARFEVGGGLGNNV